jgi:hypothetical protein
MADPTATSAPLGFGAGPEGNAPVGPTAFSQSEQRLQREEATTAGDYVKSIWRQDSLADGLVANLAGNELTPDPSYNPFKDPNWKSLAGGVWDEFIPELYHAHSAAHAYYIKDRLLQKQEDLTRLGDMGWGGNVGRFALNAVMPDQLLMAMAGGWVARGVKYAEVAAGARAAGKAATPVAAAETMAGVVSEQAARAASPKALAAGVGFGAAENAAYEKLRQSVNFEHDDSTVLEAGLMGAAITAPFALVGSRGARSVAAIAEKEHATLKALRAADEGHALTPEQGQLIREVHTAHEALRKFEAGHMDEAGLQKAMDELHGPQEPPERWLERYHEQLRQDARAVIEDLFPGHEGRATGRAAPSPAEKAQIDQRVALEDTNFAPDVTHAAPAEPVKTAMQLAFERAQGARKAKAKENEKLRKAFDIEEAHAQTDAAKKAERDAAHAQAEAERQAAIQADQERMINAREEAHMLATEDPVDAAVRQSPTEAPGSPQELLNPTANTEVAPPPLERWIGRDVSWLHKSGEEVAGTVHSISPTGKLVVDTGTGPKGMLAVAEHELDQFDGKAPSGFLHGSVGSAQVEKVQSIAGQRAAMAEVTIPGTNVKVPTRFDIFATLNGSPLETVRKLAYKLVKDAIQNDKFEAQAMTASEWKKQLQRTVAGRFHVEAKEAYKEGLKAAGVLPWQRPQFAHEFYRLVSRVTRGDADVLAQYPHLEGPLQKAAKAQAKVYASLLEQAQKAGVKGAESVTPNDFYVNRMWDHRALRDASATHGHDAVVRLVAESIQDKAGIIERFKQSPAFKAKPGMTDAAILQQKAKRFIKAVRALEFSPALQDMHLAGRDMGTLRSELKVMGVEEGQIDDLVDVLFEVKAGEGDAGRTGNLKFRFGLDESTSMVTDKGTLKLSDLFENDSRVLVDRYTNSMSGHIGLAKAGIDSQATWARELKRISDEAMEDPLIDGGRVAKDIALLDDIHRNITGRPMSTQDFSYANRAATALRGYTRGVMLPQLGIAAAFEMNKAIAMMGFKSLQQLPSFRSMLTAMRQGYIPDEGLARDIMLITGFGQEKAASYMRAQEIENGFFGQALTRAEAGANGVSHAVDVLSGNASFTSLTKQLSGMMAVQNMHDFASGRKVLTDSLKERWVGQGISQDDIDQVLSHLKQFSHEDSGVVKQIRHEDWLKEHPKSYEQFQTFLSRQVRDAIQDHDLGETMPFMHTTLGKVFSELKTFFLVAHAKNFLKNLHYADATALQVWTIGFIGESLAYMTQTAVNYPSELDTRLTPEKISTAAFFRMSALGTASMLTETGYNLLSGGDSLVQPGMTANTDNRSFLNTPSLMIAKRVLNAPSTLGGLMLGTDATTKQEARDLWGTIPGGNLYGLKAVGQWWANSFPSSDPDKARTGH